MAYAADRGITTIFLAVILCTGSVSGSDGAESLRRIQVDDISIGYIMRGEGYPLLMIMGFGGTMDMWDPEVVSVLENHRHLILFDNRGMGETTSGDREFSIEQFADDTSVFMDSLGIVKADVFAWSMGTEIALELVLRHPDKVGRLILYAGDYQVNACPPSPEVFQVLTDTSGSPAERGERLMGVLFPHDWLDLNMVHVMELFSGFTETSSAENIQKQSDAMDSWAGAAGRLWQIESPTLLISGTEDVLTPPRNSELLLELIPGARLELIENGGHGVMYQYPGLFSDIVLDFLQEDCPPSSG